ncbi:hypothetical protein BHYA_0161g00210 [Botrytis hyacinthi]|uniref:Cytochrome P450 n=1 Tax=Botrytis hyacinthi TaxID=278943 RepID=A0A4Z1GEK8_9HELO|nr:hypothetical protein BHYA_0161g00210 [Botrytis hyacinthi]
MWNLINITSWMTALAALRLSVRVIYRRFSYRNAMLANGCSNPKKYAHKDPFFGIDKFVSLAEAMQSGSMLATVEGLFATYGKTFQSNSWGTTVINTMDPLVIQTVLANSSEKFGVAPSQIPTVFFTADGQSWAYHRSIAKQIFFGVRFSVIPSLEKHVNSLLELIHRDGSTIDLQPLLKRILNINSWIQTNKTELRNQLLNPFLPARDSTSIVSIGDAPITFDLLKSMKYLKFVVNENLRLLALAGLSIRTCVEDCVLPRGGGPDGTEIRIVFHALHKDRDIWGEDAMEFRPERWENLRTTWEYIPFLGGGRICPAQQMALTEVSYLVVRFMKEFKVIENRDPEKKFVAGMKLSMESKNGVKVGFEVA